MLDGLFFLFLFFLSLLTYPFRRYHKHKRKEKQQQEKPIIYHLSRIDKTLETLEYGRYGESTAELDLEDEEY
jgi:hypothetical protein